MAAHFNDDNNDLLELAESYVDLFPPRLRANPLTDSKEVEFRAQFRDPVFCKRFGIHDNETGAKLHRHEYSCLC